MRIGATGCHRRAALAASAVLAALVAGCGGDSSKYGDDSAVPAAFRQRALTVCKRALAAKEALGPWPYPDFNPTRPDWDRYPGVARALATTPGVFSTWLDGMEKLGEPATGRAAWDDLVAAIRDHVRIATEQYGAAVRRDSETFTKDYEDGSDVQDALLEAATAAGVPECAAVDR